MESRGRINKPSCKLIIAIIIVFIIPVAFLLFYELYIDQRLDQVTVELGQTPDLDCHTYFVSREWRMKTAVIDDSNVDIMRTGDYPLLFNVSKKDYKVTVHVVDTTAPEFCIKDNQYVIKNEKVNSNFFVEEVSDLSGNVDVLFEDNNREEISFEEIGIVEVKLAALDSNGNKNVQTAWVHVDEPPVFVGNKDFHIVKNELLNPLEYISAYDSTEGDMTKKIIVNDLFVNTKVPGEYTIFYDVTDKYGFKAHTTAKVYVYESEEELPEYKALVLSEAE